MQGTAYCHAKSLCHRDLKLENLLLDSTGKVLKVGEEGAREGREHLTPHTLHPPTSRLPPCFPQGRRVRSLVVVRDTPNVQCYHTVTLCVLYIWGPCQIWG